MSDKKEEIIEALCIFAEGSGGDVYDIVSMWANRNELEWPTGVRLYRKIAQRVLSAGELRAALDMAERTVKRCKTDFIEDGVPPMERKAGDEEDLFILHQVAALARARMGYTAAAQRTLKDLDKEANRLSASVRAHIVSETKGILARTYKDLFLSEEDPAARERWFEESFRRYFEFSGLEGRPQDVAYWHAINAATLAYLQGDKRKARSYAKKTLLACGAPTDAPASDRYWCFATVAEAELLLGVCGNRDLGRAKSAYRTAAKVGGANWSDIQSTRRHLRLILSKHFFGDKARIDKWMDQAMPMPPIILFTGHMVDSKKRKQERPPRFPAIIENDVKDEIRKQVANLCPRKKPFFGYGSAACGSDILFHEVIQELGGRSMVVLPYNRDDFAKDSVKLKGAGRWSRRYKKVLENAAEVTMPSQQKLRWGSVPYQYTNEYLVGLAVLKAKELEMPLKGLAVWDRKKGDGVGGTADNVAMWKRLGIEHKTVDINKIREKRAPSESGNTDLKKGVTPSEPKHEEYPSQVMGLLFADVKGFSKLTDQDMPGFVTHFWSGIANLIRRHSDIRPIMANTWGDALYMVFEEIEHAGRMALALKKYAGRHPWKRKGFTKDLTFRVALHAGPVYYLDEDRIMGRPNYFGWHVCKAARLEPVTDEGQVFATDAFAALAATRNIESFRCEYVGRVKLPKDFGMCETFRVVDKSRAP